jgi:RimJ/RimL family protein N-acetyltransferase
LNDLIQPIVLTGRWVRLEPLAESHISDLAESCLDESIWRYMPYGWIRTPEQMASLIRDVMTRRDTGSDFGFAIIYRETDRAVGCSRYFDIQLRNRALEIGGTWYAPAYQRTGVNTESKFLLLRHAFETLGYQRVQFKTDLRNERSQRALERIGAVKEGVLRQNMVMPDGYLRSSVVYSILADEWPAVKSHLERLMVRPNQSDGK